MTTADKCPRCGTPLLRDAARGLCPKCLVRLGHLVGRHGLAAQDRHQRDHAGHLGHAGEVELGVVRGDVERACHEVALDDRDPGLKVPGGDHDRLLGTRISGACVESYEDEGDDDDNGQKNAEEGEWPARSNCAKRPQGRQIIGKICRCGAPLT